MSNPTKLIKVVTQVDGAAIGKLQTYFKNLNKEVNKTSTIMGQARMAFLSLFAGLGIRSLAQSADSFQLLSDRMKVFTGSAEAAAETMLNLQGLASYAKTSIESLSTSYTRLALSTQELGLSQEQILGTTLALQQTFRISGATIAEATAATIQLSQGLSSGQLRGQELRSVMEQNTLFAGMLAEELGIARGQLIKFAESGKITSDVVLRTLAKNFGKLNDMASKMGVTFEQSLTISMDALRMKLHQLNQEFGLSAKFAIFAKYVVNNLGQITTAIISTGIALKAFTMTTAAWSAISKAALAENVTMWVMFRATAITSIAQINAALIRSFWAAAFVGLGVLIGDVILNFDKWKLRVVKSVDYVSLALQNFVNLFNGTIIQGIRYGINFISNAFESLTGFSLVTWFLEMADSVGKFVNRFVTGIGYLIQFIGLLGKKIYHDMGLDVFFAAVAEYLGLAIEKFEQFAEYLSGTWVGKVYRAFKETIGVVGDWFSEIKKQTDKETGKPVKIFDTEGTQKDIDSVNAKLEKLNKTSDNFSMAAITAAMKEQENFAALANRATEEFYQLNIEIQRGNITLGTYANAVSSIKQAELNTKFKAGKIAVDEYYKSLAAIPGAIDDITKRSDMAIASLNAFNGTISKIGTFTTQMTSVIEASFSHLEDGFARLVTEGKFGMKEFTTSVIEDLARMTTRLLIVLPLVNALKAAMGGATVSPSLYEGQATPAGYEGTSQYAMAGANTNAKGNAFHGGNVIPFARGGVVTRPTLFPMANGAGLMGESGPEAIIPLARSSDGKLGVRGGGTVINITNNSSAQIESKETTNAAGDKQLDLLIVDKVARAIGNGQLDRSFSQSYGMKRRGM